MSTTTYIPKPGEVKQDWHIVDATNLVLGRLAAKVAMIVQGKTKPTYTPYRDTGDFVIILNAEKVRVTGKKADAINFETYSKFPGGRRLYPYKKMIVDHPEKVVELAIRRMLPKNRIGRTMLKHVKIFSGDKHPHAAQQPKALKLADL